MLLSIPCPARPAPRGRCRLPLEALLSRVVQVVSVLLLVRKFGLPKRAAGLSIDIACPESPMRTCCRAGTIRVYPFVSGVHVAYRRGVDLNMYDRLLLLYPILTVSILDIQ